MRSPEYSGPLSVRGSTGPRLTLGVGINELTGIAGHALMFARLSFGPAEGRAIQPQAENWPLATVLTPLPGLVCASGRAKPARPLKQISTPVNGPSALQ